MTMRSRLIAAAVIGALSSLPSFAFAQSTQPAPAAKPPAAAPAPAAKPGEAKPAAELMDINTATKEQLMTLEGIAEARSDAIIKGRPYKAKNELADRKIIPEAVYEKIKDKIIARQVAAKPATPAAAPAAPAATPAKK